MKKYVLLVLATAFFYLAGAQQPKTNTNNAFNAFKLRFIDALWKMYPEWATKNGYHKYDSVLSIPNEDHRSQQKQLAYAYHDSVQGFKLSELDIQNQTDHQLIANQMQYIIWNIESKKDYEWNPAQYNITGNIAFIINEPWAPLEKRLITVGKKMETAAAYYMAAQENIRQPVTELKDLAIEQNANGLSVLQTDLLDSLKRSKLPEAVKSEIAGRASEAVEAIQNYIRFLRGINEEGRSFRMGEKLYSAEYHFRIQSSLTVDSLYAAAVERKGYLTSEMERLAASLWSKYFPNQKRPADRQSLVRNIIDTISADHIAPADFLSSIEKQLPKLAAFVRSKNLLYLDPSKPLKVRKEPGYMAGVAGASISAPGPYDKGGKTYYNVGTLEGWSAQRAESYLREYNNYTMQILNIHEAIPGHYAQLVYSNKSPDLIKSILGNGSMIEGWAVYSELMMMEAGYDPSPEMMMMYYKWNLRSVCNTILDIGVHTRNMSKEDALNLLINEAFQQEAEAEGKWRRVSVSSVQLTSYFNGFYEIVQLRDAWKRKMGAAYTVKAFNEKFLSYGSVPVKYIREMMLSGK